MCSGRSCQRWVSVQFIVHCSTSCVLGRFAHAVLSLRSGVFPTSYKQSHITPLLKSPSLDCDSLQSYRPVSNLSFLSKVIETAVANQLMKHFDQHKLLDQHQSAYRPNHSVETALQHVYSSILHQLDRGRAVFLVLIDLSAAFDTVSHDHLLSLLSSRFGIGGSVLRWIQSYLSGRSYRVKINNELSAPVQCNVGVPQGSVLGPILFNCVMSVLPKLLRDIGIGCHTYADDTQFWVSYNETGDFNDEETARRRIKQAFGLISKFMNENHLKLNPKKTQFIPFSRKTKSVDFGPLVLSDDVSISPSSEVRNLGLTMDSDLNFHSHVSDLRKSCFFHLKRLKAIRCFIPKEQFATLIHAFITSRLDFCNSLYYRLPNNLITRIQTVQNACAKCLTGRKKYDSATQARMDLHWLPIRARASFKILVSAHRVVYSSSPYYLSSAFSTTKDNRANTLKGTFDCRLTTVGARSIYITLRELWNSFPEQLREMESLPRYKANLKTHLFNLYYP